MKVEIFGDADIFVQIFDPINKSLIGIRSNFKKASVFLGISDIKIRKYCHSKRRIFSPHLNKVVAVRIANITALPDNSILVH